MDRIDSHNNSHTCTEGYPSKYPQCTLHYTEQFLIAVENNSIEVVNLLISEYECDINVKGSTLLHMINDVDSLTLLIKKLYKISLSCVDNEGNTPLMTAV